MSERIEALDLDVKDWHRWDETKRHDYVENLLKGLTGAKRDELISELPQEIDAVKEGLKQELEELHGIRRGDRSESEAQQIDLDRQLLRDLASIPDVVHLVDSEQDILNIEATGGAASFSGYKLDGQTYNINFTDSTAASPFGGSATPADTAPPVDNDPFAAPGQAPTAGADGTDQPQDPAAPAPPQDSAQPAAPVNPDANADGIADQDFNHDGVINYNDLVAPKPTDMLDKPHVMLMIKEGDLADVVGWNPDTKVLQVKIYNAEGKVAYLNINGIDPANFALLFDGGVSEQNLDSYKSNVPPELLKDFYWKDSTDSFADRLGLAPEVLPADRLASIPKYNEIQASFNNLDDLSYSGPSNRDEVKKGFDKIFGLMDQNKLSSDQVRDTIHQIVTDTESLGDEEQKKIFTTLVIIARMHFDDATLSAILGPSVLEIEDVLNPTKNPADMNKNQILATIALETVAPGNYGGPETLMNKLFSAGMGTVGDFSGQEGIDALKLIQDFSTKTGLYLPGVDTALKNEQDLETSGGVIQISDGFIAGLASASHAAATVFASVPDSGTDAQAIDAGLMTLINTIQASGPRVAMADVRTKIIDTMLTFPTEAQDDIMAAFLTLTHEGSPEFFKRLTADPQFIANSWSIVDNGNGKPGNYEKIMGWLQTAATEQEKETEVPSSGDESGRMGKYGDWVTDDMVMGGWKAGFRNGELGPLSYLFGAIGVVVGAVVGAVVGDLIGGIGVYMYHKAKENLGVIADGAVSVWHAITPW